jgi:hypothetical protein
MMQGARLEARLELWRAEVSAEGPRLLGVQDGGRGDRMPPTAGVLVRE